MKKKITLERSFNQPIEKVWEAISDENEISKWFLPAKFKAEIGFQYTFTHVHDQGTTYITGEVLTVDKPNTLSYTWESSGSDVNTTVIWNLKEEDGITKLMLEHESHDNEDNNPNVGKMFEEFSNGWPEVIGNLEKYLL